MPAVSKKQAGLLGAIAAGTARKKTGLTKEQAREFLRGTKVKKLPRFARSPVTTGLLDAMKGRNPVSLKGDDGPFTPSISLNLNKFPRILSSKLGDKLALLLQGEVESLHQEKGEAPRGRIRLLDAVISPVK